jgi:hypothetical protein
MFIAGRYEYRNKGADMFIEALARLNHSPPKGQLECHRRRIHYHARRHSIVHYRGV